MEYTPHPTTILFVSVFMVLYLGYLFRRAVSEKVDIYDFVLLSTVALVPSTALYFPRLSVKVSNYLGVELPFVLMFGFLFFIVFVFLHRLVAMGKANERKITALVQETALLKAQLKREQVKTSQLQPRHFSKAA